MTQITIPLPNVSAVTLSGVKTYVVALATVAFAGLSYWHGTMDLNTAISTALGGAGLGALRHGITTSAIAKAEAVAAAAVAAYDAAHPLPLTAVAPTPPGAS